MPANHGKRNVISQGAISAEKQQSIANAHFKASQIIARTIASTLQGVQREVAQRAYRASNELRNAELYVLRGERSGRLYRVPNTKKKYRASAPGEPPAVRTGAFRLSWGTRVHVEQKGTLYRAVSAIESRERAGGQLLGEMLENGTGKTAPRPYKQKIIDRAMPKVKEIYGRPYHP
ncbi:MAG: hypothetical protein HFF08_07200 [Oscillospiraceae bacterium]|nr:hypothetical protein [Oscillospiraceae bacterium]